MEAASFYEESSNIPQEIIIEILSRLPAKSLLKFRCVRKSWNSLISSSQFVKTHLKLSSKSNNLENYSIILGSCYSRSTNPYNTPRKFFNCSISSILTNYASINPIILDFPGEELSYISIVGTCNGLLCLSTHINTLILCNPTTKKLKKLLVQISAYFNFANYGFCYDKLNDDYKVVMLLTPINRSIGYETKWKVYSLRDNYWREFEGLPDGRLSHNTGICVSGILHWSAYTNSKENFIICLDIVTYVYGNLEMPKYDQTTNDNIKCTLLEFGGCLGVICDYYEVRADIWVMKQYGVKESWIMLVSIPYPINPKNGISLYFGSVYSEVILNYDPLVMFRKSTNSSQRSLKIWDSTGCLLCPVSLPYLESLVPLTFDV